MLRRRSAILGLVSLSLSSSEAGTDLDFVSDTTSERRVTLVGRDRHRLRHRRKNTCWTKPGRRICLGVSTGIDKAVSKALNFYSSSSESRGLVNLADVVGLCGTRRSRHPTSRSDIEIESALGELWRFWVRSRTLASTLLVGSCWRDFRWTSVSG